jgi:predicted AAA+ superfamily ATPase
LSDFRFRIVRHWRGPHGEEVDIVLEDRAGMVIAIEIKSGATVTRGGLGGLKKLAALAGERFVAGLVLCTTRQTMPLGRRMWATPIEALWL